MIETNLSIRDMCIGCGHYHYPVLTKKNARRCTAGPANGGDCRCTKFVGRSFKSAYA